MLTKQQSIEVQHIKLAYMNPKKVSREIGDFVINKITASRATGGVIGLSGGIDSTTTSAILKDAFSKYNALKEVENRSGRLELVGYILPSKTNSPKDAEDGIAVAEKLGIRYEVLSIEPIVEAFYHTNPEAFNKSYDKGNLMSRIRANVLSTKAATEKKWVIGTGNKDEDFGVGYYTLFGDGAVHISPIGNLPKRLVRQMAAFYGFDPYFVNRIPTAGLEPGQTDFKDLGYTYEAAELIINGFHQGISKPLLYFHPEVRSIVLPFLKDSKFSNIEDIVNDVYKRHYGDAASKASLIHPPIPEITLEYR